MHTRQFEFREGSSDKFWRITLNGSTLTVNFGRRGTGGQTQTKEFAGNDAAQKAYDKLIQEKLQKGYVEVDGEPVAAESPVQPPVRAPERKSNPVARPVEPLILEPEEWAYATWRPRAAKPRPKAPGFSLPDGMKRLERVLGSYGWRGSWDDARMPAAMTREEARFWLEGIAAAHRLWFNDLPSESYSMQYSPEPVLRELAGIDYSSRFSLEQAADLLNRTNLPTAILLPLYHLFPWHEVIALLDRLEKRNGRDYLQLWDNVFRESMYWHLSDHELDALREGIRRWLPDVEWPQRLESASWVLPLAGQVGGLDRELKPALNALPAQSYGVTRLSYLFDVVFGLSDPADVVEHVQRQQLVLHRREYIAAWLAHTELTALDQVVQSLAVLSKSDGASPTRAFTRMVNAPEAAPAMLALLNTKNPAPAKEWLDAHPRETFIGLLPLVTSSDKQTAERAIEFVRSASAAVEPADRDTAYASLSDAARRKLEARESSPAGRSVGEVADGLRAAFEFASRQKMKAPQWITAANVPPLMVEGGRLPEEYTNVLLAALRHGDPRVPHPFVLAIRCYVTPESLDAFAGSVFEQWRTLGMESREKWALFTMGAFGSDRAALQLAPYVRNWPGESKSPAAILGLEVLRNIGTDTAILQINAIAQKTKFAALKKRAQECMQEIAADRGLSRDELEDRIVPDCGLDARGTRIFDFGPRQFELRISEGLKPVVVAPDGTRKPNLPPPNSKDDSAKADAAVAEWKIVKKQVADVAKTQVTRLEQALVTQRRWTAADFKHLLVDHPLMTNLVRLLVWGVYEDARLAATFRVAEDRTYTNQRDDVFEMEDSAIVGLPHPLQIGESDRNTWGELLGDYEILPPFAQLNRAVQRLTPEERRANRVTRHTGVALEPVVFGSVLQSRGWMRGQVGDGGSILEHVKYFPGADLTAVLAHTPLIVGYYDLGEKTSPEKLFFVRGYSRGEWGGTEENQMVQLDLVDEVVISETLADLDYLASKEKR